MVAVVGEPTTNIVSLTWTNGFDGFSSITGVEIEYQINGSLTSDALELGVVEAHTLMELRPFTDYEIQVFVVNAIGRSNPGTTTATTVSLSK